MRSALAGRICVCTVWKGRVVTSLLVARPKCGAVTVKMLTLNKANRGYYAFDQVKFYEVSETELLQMREDFKAGRLQLRIEDGVLNLKEYNEF